MEPTRLAPAAALLCVVYIGCAKTAEPGREGEACSKERPCREGLVCEWLSDRCRTPHYIERKKQRYAERAAKERAQKRARELALLKQSGVAEPAASERRAEAPDPRGRTAGRVARTTGVGDLFAACRSDERLVSGGCRSSSSYTSVKGSYPAGSRWICEFESRYAEPKTEAFAICKRH